MPCSLLKLDDSTEPPNYSCDYLDVAKKHLGPDVIELRTHFIYYRKPRSKFRERESGSVKPQGT
jgi:hypothetical protein